MQYTMMLTPHYLLIRPKIFGLYGIPCLSVIHRAHARDIPLSAL